MFRWRILLGLLVPCAATNLLAQTSARPIDPAFVRAQALVSDGNGVAGRALIDSVLAATPTNAPLYPQGLFWRATLASNAADAESDYKHIVVDYPLAPQAEDALLRLAQLELARGDRDGALGHLQRIPRDYPRSKSLARASYWTARVLFEKNDIPNACIANTGALLQAGADEIELRNQIQYQGQRCPKTPTAVTSAVSDSMPARAAPLATAPATYPGNLPGPPAAATSKTATVVAGPVGAERGTSDNAPRLPSDSVSGTLVSPAPKTPVRESSEPLTAKPVTGAKDSVGQPTIPAKKQAQVSPKPSTTSSSSKAGGEYSVQLAAYNHKPDAEKLAASLVKRGYQARVDGDIVPFRVRIGRYSTEREAEDALKKIKAKHMDGFIARAPQR